MAGLIFSMVDFNFPLVSFDLTVVGLIFSMVDFNFP